METTRIVVVDDEALFRELLVRTLSAEPGLEVVGQADDGETAVILSREQRPDVVLMDIELPGDMDGIEAALQIKNESPETGVVILSAHSERRYVTSLPLEDIQGWAYLLKQTVPDLATIVRAIQGSKPGMVVLDPAVLLYSFGYLACCVAISRLLLMRDKKHLAAFCLFLPAANGARALAGIETR